MVGDLIKLASNDVQDILLGDVLLKCGTSIGGSKGIIIVNPKPHKMPLSPSCTWYEVNNAVQGQDHVCVSYQRAYSASVNGITVWRHLEHPDVADVGNDLTDQDLLREGIIEISLWGSDRFPDVNDYVSELIDKNPFLRRIE